MWESEYEENVSIAQKGKILILQTLFLIGVEFQGNLKLAYI